MNSMGFTYQPDVSQSKFKLHHDSNRKQCNILSLYFDLPIKSSVFKGDCLKTRV